MKKLKIKTKSGKKLTIKSYSNKKSKSTPVQKRMFKRKYLA